jgi:hypothetical protein
MVYDKDSGRVRGLFGFVIFSNEDDANSAKDAMDRLDFNSISYFIIVY